MKKVILICNLILILIMSACSSKQVTKNETFVVTDLQSDDEISADTNLLSELEEFENTVRNNKKSKRMSKLIDKYIKAVLRRAYNEDIANEYVQDSCKYYFSEGMFTIANKEWWDLQYHTPKESNIKINVSFGDYSDPYSIKVQKIDSSGYESFHFSTNYIIIDNIKRYFNYDEFIVGTSNELIDTEYDELKLLDKVKYGSIGNVDMIWTVCKKSEGKVLLCSDYAFNINNEYYGNYEETAVLASDLSLLNSMFNDNELSHLIKYEEKDWKYGYYYFTLPTSIYDKNLDDESKNVIGTIDLNYLGFGPNSNSQDISKCSSYDVGILPKESYSTTHDTDGIINKYMRFHLNDRYGEVSMAFKRSRNENNIPTRLCVYVTDEKYNKIANYNEYKKLDCIKLSYYLAAEEQKLGPNKNVFPYDDYVEKYTNAYKNYKLLDSDNNDITRRYKDKTIIYDYNVFIKDIYKLLKETQIDDVTFHRIFNDTKIKVKGKCIDMCNTFKQENSRAFYKYEIKGTLPKDFYDVINQDLKSAFYYINSTNNERKHAIDNNEIYLYQGIRKKGERWYFNQKKSFGEFEIVFCIDHIIQNDGKITLIELEDLEENYKEFIQSRIEEESNKTFQIETLISNCKIGDIFKFETIDWQLINKKEGKALFVTTKPFYVEEIPEEEKNNKIFTYSGSKIREFLNSVFIEKYLPSDIKNIITTTKVKNSTNNEFGINLGEDIIDKVFVLSIDEEKDAEKIIDSYEIFEKDRKFIKREKYKYRNAGDASNKLAIWNYNSDGIGYVDRKGELYYYKYPVRLGMWVQYNNE